MFKRLISVAVLAGVLSLTVVACNESPKPGNDPVSRLSPPPPPAAPSMTTTLNAEVSACKTPEEGDDTTVSVSLEDLGGSGEYKFGPSDFTFSVGETVTFELTSETEFHTFTLDDFGIDESVEAGETVSCTVSFDDTGIFPLICIPHELDGMLGTIVIQ